MSSACTFRQLLGQVVGQTLEGAAPVVDLQLGVAREEAPPVVDPPPVVELPVGKAMEGAPPVRMTLPILRTS
jgi:hypothetical protein